MSESRSSESRGYGSAPVYSSYQGSNVVIKPLRSSSESRTSGESRNTIHRPNNLRNSNRSNTLRSSSESSESRSSESRSTVRSNIFGSSSKSRSGEGIDTSSRPLVLDFSEDTYSSSSQKSQYNNLEDIDRLIERLEGNSYSNNNYSSQRFNEAMDKRREKVEELKRLREEAKTLIEEEEGIIEVERENDEIDAAIDSVKQFLKSKNENLD